MTNFFSIIRHLIKQTHPLKKACFLAQLGNVSSVIMSEHLVSKNGICNLETAENFSFNEVLNRCVIKLLYEEITDGLDRTAIYHRAVNDSSNEIPFPPKWMEHT